MQLTRNQPMRFQRERNSTPMAEWEEIILSSDTDTDDDQLARLLFFLKYFFLSHEHVRYEVCVLMHFILALMMNPNRGPLYLHSSSVGTATSHTPAQQSQSQLATATNDVSFDLITVKKIIERLHVILTRTSNNTVSVDANLLQLEGSWDRLDFGTNCNAERNRAYKKYWEDVLIPRLVHDSDDLLQPILSAIPTDETQLLRRAAAGYVKHTPSSCPSSNEQRTPSSVNSSPAQNSA